MSLAVIWQVYAHIDYKQIHQLILARGVAVQVVFFLKLLNKAIPLLPVDGTAPKFNRRQPETI